MLCDSPAAWWAEKVHVESAGCILWPWHCTGPSSSCREEPLVPCSSLLSEWTRSEDSASCIRDSSRRVLLAPGGGCHVLGHNSANIQMGKQEPGCKAPNRAAPQLAQLSSALLQCGAEPFSLVYSCRGSSPHWWLLSQEGTLYWSHL